MWSSLLPIHRTGAHKINDASSPTKKMEDLEVGDEVLTANTQGRLFYTPVITFLDRLPSITSYSVEIETEDQQIIRLTSYFGQ